MYDDLHVSMKIYHIYPICVKESLIVLSCLVSFASNLRQFDKYTNQSQLLQALWNDPEIVVLVICFAHRWLSFLAVKGSTLQFCFCCRWNIVLTAVILAFLTISKFVCCKIIKKFIASLFRQNTKWVRFLDVVHFPDWIVWLSIYSCWFLSDL